MEEASELLQIVALVGAKCVGIGFNMGSDCDRMDLYSDAIECCARLYKMAYRLGLKLKILNIGGGFSSLHREWHYARFEEVV